MNGPKISKKIAATPLKGVFSVTKGVTASAKMPAMGAFAAMAIRRIFLDWSKSALPAAAEYLIGRCAKDGVLDLSGLIVIVPGSRAGRRLLEILVHLDRSQVPSDYVVMAIRFDDELIGDSPAKHSSSAGIMSPAQFRRVFYRRPVLRAPSVIVPREVNYVLFPQAPDFQAEVEWVEPLNFDERLFAFR